MSEQFKLEVKPSLETLNVERLANPFEMINPVVKGQLQEFTKGTSETLRSVGKQILNLAPFKALPKTTMLNLVVHKLEKRDYTVNMDMQLPIPNGLISPLDEYAYLLQESWVVARDFAERSISRVDDYISTIISHPERLGHITETSLIEAMQFNESRIESFKLRMENSFSKTKQSELATFGQLFKRNKDFHSFGEAVILLAKDYDTRNNTQLKNHVDKLSEKSSLLHTKIKQGKININNSTAANIALVLHKTAVEVDFYASLCVLIEELILKFGEMLNSISDDLSA